MGGLIGSANASKTGLLSDTVYRRRLQYFTVSNDLVVVVAKLNYKYGTLLVKNVLELYQELTIHNQNVLYLFMTLLHVNLLKIFVNGCLILKLYVKIVK